MVSRFTSWRSTNQPFAAPEPASDSQATPTTRLAADDPRPWSFPRIVRAALLDSWKEWTAAMYGRLHTESPSGESTTATAGAADPHHPEKELDKEDDKQENKDVNSNNNGDGNGQDNRDDNNDDDDDQEDQEDNNDEDNNNVNDDNQQEAQVQLSMPREFIHISPWNPVQVPQPPPMTTLQQEEEEEEEYWGADRHFLQSGAPRSKPIPIPRVERPGWENDGWGPMPNQLIRGVWYTPSGTIVPSSPPEARDAERRRRREWERWASQLN